MIEPTEAVIHHVYHNTSDGRKREITINGATTNVSISSDDPKDTIKSLSSKALELFKQIRGMDRD